MPKFSALAWVVIVVALVTYGLLVFAITRSYYQDTRMVTTQAPTAAPEVPVHPKVSPFDATLQPAVKYQPSAEELATEDPALIARLADDYFMKKEYPQAIELYERVLKINPDDVESYNDLGLSLFYIGQSQRAVEALQTGVSKQPDFQRIQLTLGFVQAQLGDKEAAATAFQKAIELGPENTVGQEAKRMLSEMQ
ncbi:tetratricopeptide repeat protein [Candidatus Thiodiazotropha sp. CDECU1]|uniref:tetratricopeptide repeat protein n=1 Tax=Candidatus Thiodiazotropha sp. CDECU1 TaxID=3065865 RepID=UPI00292FFD2B|nr:tetratricopeptide repeat protein [Candidatus Thiodiazotropha sp. CDECU1]